jgi:type IV secretory pathway VirB2 component (pilin)
MNLANTPLVSFGGKLDHGASGSHARVGGWVLMAFLMLLAFTPGSAFAQIEVPFIQDFGCDVVQWLRGPLAVVIFVMVVVVTLIFGMITKMDWGRIITVCIIFGIVLGLGRILSGSEYMQNLAGLNACLM